MKNSILLPVFFLLFLLAAFFSLLCIRSVVFLLLHYQPGTGIQFSLIRYNFFYLCKQIYPFAVLFALVLLYIRWSRKPGNIAAYFLVFIIAGAAWFGGIGLFAPHGEDIKNETANPFFPGTIHRLENADVYAFETKSGNLIHPVFVYKQEEADGPPQVRAVETLELDFEQNRLVTPRGLPPIPIKPVHPVISPVVTVRGFAKNLLAESIIFEKEIYRLYDRHRGRFILISAAVLGFFIFGSIITRISQVPLFKICGAILLFRLFFSLFRQFFNGTAKEMIDFFIKIDLYHPLIGIGYAAAIFFLFTLSFHLRSRRSSRGEALP